MILKCRWWEVLFVHIVFIVLLQKKSRFDFEHNIIQADVKSKFPKIRTKKIQFKKCIYHLLSNFFTLIFMSQVHVIIFHEFQIYMYCKNDCFY